MPPRGRLPPLPKYDDEPVWPNNRDDVAIRAVNAAWDALYKIDLDDISFKTLAKSMGITTAALYYHYPTLTHLGAELACRGCATLHSTLTLGTSREIPRPKPLKEFVNQYLEFAGKRKRHFALMFSPRFGDAQIFPGVLSCQLQLGQATLDLMEAELGSKPSVEDLHVFWGIIHGSATLIAANHVPQPRLLLRACEAYLDGLRK